MEIDTKKIVKTIPSALTFANLIFGYSALMLTLKDQFEWAAVLIVLAGWMDFFDGRLARRLEVVSGFGKELDSLCDLVSFGVVPAVLVYTGLLQERIGLWGAVLTLLFVISGTFRLARFNSQNIKTHFVGLPITMAGGSMALLVLFQKIIPWQADIVFIIFFCWFMVSKVKLPKI